jgi:hypothetical protein
MRMIRTIVGLALLAVMSSTSSCGCKGAKYPQPQPASNLDWALTRLNANNEQAKSFRAKSSMDYWLGGDRVKGPVWVQGKLGSFMRFNALNPANSTVAVDLACQGADFKYLDYQNNCKLVGPCDKESIAQLLRVRLAPDDFLLLAMGSSPLLDTTDGSIAWDSDNGQYVIALEHEDGRKQKLRVNVRGENWDVMESVMYTPAGVVEWKLTNKDFGATKTESGDEWRVPAKSRFEQPADKGDLIVDWRDRSLNLELTDDLFDFPLDMGIPTCGQSPAPAPTAGQTP